MARYIQQPSIGFPSQSGQNIAHFIEMFEEPSAAALQVAVNAFFVSLEGLTEFPIIQRVQYEFLQQVLGMGAGDFTYSAMVHYILVD